MEAWGTRQGTLHKAGNILDRLPYIKWRAHTNKHTHTAVRLQSLSLDFGGNQTWGELIILVIGIKRLKSLGLIEITTTIFMLLLQEICKKMLLNFL